MKYCDEFFRNDIHEVASNANRMRDLSKTFEIIVVNSNQIYSKSPSNSVLFDSHKEIYLINIFYILKLILCRPVNPFSHILSTGDRL